MSDARRRYEALVTVSDPAVLGQYLADHLIAPAEATLQLGVTGIEVEDFNLFGSGVNPFPGRKSPKPVPDIETLTWRSTEFSELRDSIGSGNKPADTELVYLTNGIVQVEPIRLRGRNHPGFNKKFRDGATLRVERLRLLSDRENARIDRILPQRRSSSILPFMGRLTLAEFPIT